MRDRILVINPNSTASVTDAIDDAIAPLRIPGGPEIACLTLGEGPPGVESQIDADGVIQPLCRVIREQEPDGQTGARHCRMRDPDRADPRPPVWRDLDPRKLGATASALHWRDGPRATSRRRSTNRSRRHRASGCMRDPNAHDRGQLPAARRSWCRRTRHGMRRDGTLPRRSRGSRAHPGRRADPGRGDYGDRPGSSRLGHKPE
jgi:hypothetical protein